SLSSNAESFSSNAEALSSTTGPFAAVILPRKAVFRTSVSVSVCLPARTERFFPTTENRRLAPDCVLRFSAIGCRSPTTHARRLLLPLRQSMRKQRAHGFLVRTPRKYSRPSHRGPLRRVECPAT